MKWTGVHSPRKGVMQPSPPTNRNGRQGKPEAGQLCRAQQGPPRAGLHGTNGVLRHCKKTHPVEGGKDCQGSLGLGLAGLLTCVSLTGALAQQGLKQVEMYGRGTGMCFRKSP